MQIVQIKRRDYLIIRIIFHNKFTIINGKLAFVPISGCSKKTVSLLSGFYGTGMIVTLYYNRQDKFVRGFFVSLSVFIELFCLSFPRQFKCFLKQFLRLKSLSFKSHDSKIEYIIVFLFNSTQWLERKFSLKEDHVRIIFSKLIGNRQ